MSNVHPNFTDFYSAWESLKKRPGATADIRRAASMDELLNLPAFYRLVEPFGWKTCSSYERKSWQRIVFLINLITDKGEKSLTLGRALALGKVNEKRVFQIIRSDSPNDIIQLRRLLVQAKPELSWKKMAEQLWYWSLKEKRNLLEEFVLTPLD